MFRIFGLDPRKSPPSRENFRRQIHPEDRDWVRQKFEQCLRERVDRVEEYRVLLADGTVRHIASSGHPVVDENGELIEFVGTAVDVTERKRAQEERERLRQLEADLAHMNRVSMMGELAASLAHEITQPIASARNNARAALNFLDQRPPDIGEVREAIDCVVGDSDRAGDIVDRIREHIKKAPPRKERFDLNAAINEVIALARSAITENCVSVQTGLADGLFPVQGDCVQVQQVVLNLVLNAVEAMGSVEAGARGLSISTEQTKTSGVLVAVRDSGPGIDPEHLERVFEAFYTTKSSGTGMGLSICRSIIDAHGGRLWAEANEPPGAGVRQMMRSSLNGVYPDGSRQVLWEDGERVFCRGWRLGDDGNPSAVLVVLPAGEHPSPSSLDRLAHEYGLKDELDGAWAVQPLELVHDGGRTMLVLEDPGGKPLDRLHGVAMEVGNFLRLAVSIASALGKVHQRGLLHKDIKPANILVNRTTGEVKLTGFGIASRLSRERRSPEPPETIAGTLAYMAPEQTGRMNRSIDSRSDLYSLGVTLYQMLTGSLPSTATDPMEWVHCHIARKPVPPSERLENVPAPVSAIIMRLLVKTPEDRYQTAGGVGRDLRRCLAAWGAERRIDDFPLGEHDMLDRLLVPEKLYGRSREVETLVTAFDRMVTGRKPELVLVSGYSGIGKSSVVNELHKVLVPPRGLFASGKFDQYKRDIPYATLAQGFQSLVRYLLGKSDAELSGWRDALAEALGPNGRLMIDLVPELKVIIGEQPPVPELPPQDARRRFQVVFRRFIGVFAQRDHPLALFLDDLQWLDAATLDLLEDLLTPPGVPHLLLIGAYRDNEVTAAHPLTRKLEAIRNAGADVHEIALAPLACEDVRQLVADALHCEPEDADQLARRVHEETAGNPFFTNQFVSSLADEGMLVFDHAAARWSWDLERIHAKGYTDNVVDLMVGKLTRLQAETHRALQQLACLGNSAETAMLSIVLGSSEGKVHAALWPAVRQELVERTLDAYRFVHDRVLEAAYTLIPEGERAAEHLRIGRLLAAQTPPEAIAEHVFEIVCQLNRGAALIDSPEEREQVAELNLMAGQRAIASTAYASALMYLAAGAALLPPDAFERRHELAFRLERHRAECEFLTGDVAAAENRLNLLSARPTGLVDLAAMTCLRVDLLTTLGRSDSAVDACLNYLRHAGIPWSAHPTNEEVQREYEHLWGQVGSRSIEALVDLSLITDPEGRATMDVLTAVVVPAV